MSKTPPPKPQNRRPQPFATKTYIIKSEKKEKNFVHQLIFINPQNTPTLTQTRTNFSLTKSRPTFLILFPPKIRKEKTFSLS